MRRIRSCCVASANYPRFQTAGGSTFVSAFGIRTINNSATLNGSRPWIVSILRTVAGFQKGTEMGSDCVQPMHSLRVLLREMRGSRARSWGDILSKSADLACYAWLRSCRPASRYRGKSEVVVLILWKRGRADCPDT